MDPKTITVLLAAINTVRRLREADAESGPDAAFEEIEAYLGEEITPAGARLAYTLAGLCDQIMTKRPEDPDEFLANLAIVGDIEDAMAGVADNETDV